MADAAQAAAAATTTEHADVPVDIGIFVQLHELRDTVSLQREDGTRQQKYLEDELIKQKQYDDPFQVLNQ